MHQGAGARIEERVVQFAAWLIGIWRWPVGDAVVRAGWPAGGERVFVVAIMHAAVRSTNHSVVAQRDNAAMTSIVVAASCCQTADNPVHLHAYWPTSGNQISTSPYVQKKKTQRLLCLKTDLT